MSLAMAKVVKLVLFVGVSIPLLLTSAFAQEGNLLGPIIRITRRIEPAVPQEYSVAETLKNAQEMGYRFENVIVFTGFGEEGYAHENTVKNVVLSRLVNAKGTTLIVLDKPLAESGIILDSIKHHFEAYSHYWPVLVVDVVADKGRISTVAEMLLAAANQKLTTSFVVLQGGQDVLKKFVELMPNAQGRLNDGVSISIELITTLLPKNPTGPILAAQHALLFLELHSAIAADNVATYYTSSDLPRAALESFYLDENPFLKAAESLASLQKTFGGSSHAITGQRETNYETLCAEEWFVRKTFLHAAEYLITLPSDQVPNMASALKLIERTLESLTPKTIRDAKIVWKGEWIDSKIALKLAFMNLTSAEEGAELIKLYRRWKPNPEEKVLQITETLRDAEAEKILGFCGIDKAKHSRSRHFQTLVSKRKEAKALRAPIPSAEDLLVLRDQWKEMSSKQKTAYLKARVALSVRDALLTVRK